MGDAFVEEQTAAFETNFRCNHLIHWMSSLDGYYSHKYGQETMHNPKQES